MKPFTDTEGLDDAVVKEAYKQLRANRAFDALSLLCDHLGGRPPEEAPALHLAHSRMAGHIGDFSEALRATEDLRSNSKVPEEWRSRAAIWSAVYWSRLGESARAWALLDSYPPPQGDLEFAVLHWSHRLTIAADWDDSTLMATVLQQSSMPKYESGSDDEHRLELEIWRQLLTRPSPTETEEVLKIVAQVSALTRHLNKPVLSHYVSFRTAQLWLGATNVAEASACLEQSRAQALVANNGFGYLSATLALLRLDEDECGKSPDAKKLVSQAIVVAGQLGIGLLPCRLSANLWTLARNAGERHRRWLHAERYRPDISRLKEEKFEEWAYIFFEGHGAELLELSPGGRLVTLPDRHPIIDFRFDHGRARAGVQCKGGATRWTRSNLRSKLPNFNEEMATLRREGLTDYVFICTTRLDETAHGWMEAVVSNNGMRLTVIDETLLATYLLQDPGLRLHLCVHAVQDDV